jgi:hypothetical protein
VRSIRRRPKLEATEPRGDTNGGEWAGRERIPSALEQPEAMALKLPVRTQGISRSISRHARTSPSERRTPVYSRAVRAGSPTAASDLNRTRVSEKGFTPTTTTERG